MPAKVTQLLPDGGRTLIDLEALRVLGEAMLQVAQRRKSSNDRLFGSLAKGTANEASDIDFLVSIDHEATLVNVIGLKQDLEALLGRDMDVVTDDSTHPRLLDEVRSAVRL